MYRSKQALRCVHDARAGALGWIELPAAKASGAREQVVPACGTLCSHAARIARCDQDSDRSSSDRDQRHAVGTDHADDAPLAREPKRRAGWISEFIANDCEPLRASGKVLTARQGSGAGWHEWATGVLHRSTGLDHVRCDAERTAGRAVRGSTARVASSAARYRHLLTGGTVAALAARSRCASTRRRRNAGAAPAQRGGRAARMRAPAAVARFRAPRPAAGR